jgi:hypothetical protein
MRVAGHGEESACVHWVDLPQFRGHQVKRLATPHRFISGQAPESHGNAGGGGSAPHTHQRLGTAYCHSSRFTLGDSQGGGLQRRESSGLIDQSRLRFYGLPG